MLKSNAISQKLTQIFTLRKGHDSLSDDDLVLHIKNHLITFDWIMLIRLVFNTFSSKMDYIDIFLNAIFAHVKINLDMSVFPKFQLRIRSKSLYLKPILQKILSDYAFFLH